MTAAFFGGIYSHSHAAHNVRDCLIPRVLVSELRGRWISKYLALGDDASGNSRRRRGNACGTYRTTRPTAHNQRRRREGTRPQVKALEEHPGNINDVFYIRSTID